MRVRTVSLVAVACLVVLAGCGGSGSSARQRNAALPGTATSGATIAPTITGVDGGDGTLTVHVTLSGNEPANTWFYQLTTDDTTALNPIANGTANTQGAPDSFVIRGLTNGVTYTVKVANWNGDVSPYASATGIPNASGSSSSSSSVALTTTTTTSCRTGGDCAIGDIGPGGGVVFFDAGTQQSWGRYMEVSPADLTPTQFGCTGSLIGTTSPNLGTGRNNTDEISLSTCGATTAARTATTYTLAGVSDWYLPSTVELNELCKFARNQKTGDTTIPCNASGTLRPEFSATYYWSSSENAADLATYQSFVTGHVLAYGKPAPAAVRAIRSFTNANGVTVSTTAAPTPCKRGGTCVVGDTGPGGGVVFYVAASKQSWGQYMEITTTEVASSGWGCNGDSSISTSSDPFTAKANTAKLVSAGCQAALTADNFVSATNASDWYLPSDGDLVLAARAGKLSASSGAWSSSTLPGCYTIYGSLLCFSRTRSSNGADGNAGRSNMASIFPIRVFSATKAG